MPRFAQSASNHSLATPEKKRREATSTRERRSPPYIPTRDGRVKKKRSSPQQTILTKRAPKLAQQGSSAHRFFCLSSLVEPNKAVRRKGPRGAVADGEKPRAHFARFFCLSSLVEPHRGHAAAHLAEFSSF